VPQKSLPVRRLSIGIVGPGNLGSALSLTLSGAGYPVKFLAARPSSAGRNRSKALAKRIKARVLTLGKEPLDSDIVWLTVPDDEIANLASSLAKSQDWKNKTVFHSSGALTSEELAPLRKAGVRGAAPEMAGVSFALEGDASAVRVARKIIADLDANAFLIDKRKKALYHAFGSFASPLVIALLASMERVAAAAGIRKSDIKPIMTPLLWQTLRNYLQKNAASAFSGPLVRGDVATIKTHVAELRRFPEIREVYIALARASLRHLPVRHRQLIERELRK
jgi:predicted short-subunit dehydrogenase-like oxidoreductase (DUF2520 family)